MRPSQVTKTLLLAALALAALAVAPGSGAAGSAERFSFGQPRGQYVAGEIIIGFRAHVSRADVARVHGRVPARVAQRFAGLRMQLLKLKRGTSVQDAIRRYQQDPAVAFAEPNYLRYPEADPTDALFGDLWGLDNDGLPHPVADSVAQHNASDHAGTPDADIDAPEAWLTEDGSSNDAFIAVIDTGVDVTHPDLDGQLWINPDDPTADGIDDDANGKTDDVNGWHFHPPGNGDDNLLPPPYPGYEHGTHVAGTIAAELNDSGTNDGIVGVCPGCKIMVLRIGTDTGDLPISAEIQALNYAKSKDVKIANMSLGGAEWSNAEREAIRLSGMLVLVAAGNSSLDNDIALAGDQNFDGNADFLSPSYPAAYTLSNILSVAASNDQDRYGYSTECFEVIASRPRCAFTNWGHDSVDLAAPGVDIESSVPGGGYETWDGTSMAAPHVAGVAGLVLAQNPAYTPAQVKNAVMNSVDKKPTLGTLYMHQANGLTGTTGTTRTGAFTRTSGRVNAAAAVAPTASAANATPLTDGNINGAKSMSTATVKGSVSWPADINDVKKRKLYAGHTYRITLAVPTGEDYDLLVWRPGTKEVWQQMWDGHPKLRTFSAQGTSIDEVVKFKAGSTGTYYIQVSAWLFKSGSYKLTVKRLS
jgi:subtilisin family serine protease